MKVLYIASWYGTKENPIKGSFFKEQFEALNNRGVDGVVLALDFRSIRRIRKWGLIKTVENDIVVFTLSLPIGPTNIIIDYLLLKVIAKYVFKKIVKICGQPEIVHAHAMEDAGIFGYFIKQKFGIKFIITEHASGLYSIKERDVKYRIYKRIYESANKIISVSPKFSEIISKLIEDRKEIDVIPNIIDFEKFYITQKSKNEKFRFISIGNLLEVKGFDIVIKAFYLHNSKCNSDSELLLVGKGPLKESLKDLAEKLGIAGKVKFLGLLSRDQIPDILSSSHCLVMGSRKETFGVVFIEALASGIPIIGTKCDGPMYIVNENNGLLVSIDDEEEMASAMNHIYCNYQYYNSNIIREEAKNKYETNIVSRRITTIYDRLS